jgi:hypothetical protein
MTVDPASVRLTAENLLAKHGLADWHFEWSDELRTVGRCKHNRKAITYSMTFLSSPPHVIVNTLLHEVSHALAGPGHGHDDHWHQIAIGIGCTGTRCAEGATKTLTLRYTIRCKRCGHTWRRNRLDPRINISNCRCGGHLEVTDHNA